MFRGSDQVASPDTGRRISQMQMQSFWELGRKPYLDLKFLFSRGIGFILTLTVFLKLDVKHMFMERSPVAIKISLLR